jgi:hypothetical protein
LLTDVKKLARASHY